MDGTVRSRSAFSQAEEELARRIRAEKEEGKEVERSFIVQHAVRYFNELHSQPLRSLAVPAVTYSPQRVTKFRLRMRFNTKPHKIRALKPKTTEKRRTVVREVRNFQVGLDDVRSRLSDHNVENGDEMFGRHVELPRVSWSTVGQENIVRTAHNIDLASPPRHSSVQQVTFCPCRQQHAALFDASS